MNKASLDERYFDGVYAADPDPWSFASSDYEQAKYDDTIDALGGRSFTNGFEIGCSIGVLTQRLAARCASLLAVDINDRALAAARVRNEAHPHVRFAKMAIPREFPAGHFGLIVVSEVAYYWSDDDLALARDRIARTAAGGIVELVHFLPAVPDYVRDGDAVHAAFLADPRYEPIEQRRAERYRIDVCRIAE